MRPGPTAYMLTAMVAVLFVGALVVAAEVIHHTGNNPFAAPTLNPLNHPYQQASGED